MDIGDASGVDFDDDEARGQSVRSQAGVFRGIRGRISRS